MKPFSRGYCSPCSCPQRYPFNQRHSYMPQAGNASQDIAHGMRQTRRRVLLRVPMRYAR